MDVLLTGASGLIGTALVESLRTCGYGVRRLVRKSSGLAFGDYAWDPERGALDRGAFSGVSAVVHLAGENLASGRWNERKKRAILESRVRGTRLVAETIAGLGAGAPDLLSASAVGYYGSRGDEVLAEGAAPGGGFLAGVCREWEAAAAAAEAAGARVVRLRFGMVLSGRGGALAKMLPVFRARGGARIGDGRQYVSWISLKDAARSVLHVLADRTVSGPVNVVAPAPVTNAEFTKTLGKVLGRPVFLAVPGFVVRLALGEMADEVLLASVRAQPAKLLASGFSFAHPELESALRAALGGEC